MGRLVIGLLIGLVLGGALTFYFFVGVPQAVIAPGSPIKPPDPNGAPAGSVQIVLPQAFLNDALGTIFTEMSPPAFPLTEATADCESKITILREGSGVQTGVSFDNDRITAPLAFTGSYASMFGCTRFSGWAQSNFAMRFDAANQVVFGQVNVETVNLDGVNPVVSALITPIVQSTLNSRVNPVKIIDGKQIAINTPVAAANGNLQAAVTDVRAEVKNNVLSLYVIYDFAGGQLTTAPASPPVEPRPSVQ